MNVEVICPLYNAESYIKELNSAIKKQKNVEIKTVSYILTEGNDNTEEILKAENISYTKINKEEFSHSKTREKVALKTEADIVVFITQDVKIEDDNWLKNLIEPIEKDEAQATFSRQISKYDNIEKYTREKNYPEDSYVVCKDDVEKMGLKAFFFSDASSAINAKIFKKLKGYDGKDLPTNEDQYIAYKLIMNGYKIKYCANSIVYHSHKFTFKQLYKRYYDVGCFYKMESYIDQFGTNQAGGGLAKYVLKRIWQEKNWSALVRFVPDMAARLMGMQKGKK